MNWDILNGRHIRNWGPLYWSVLGYRALMILLRKGSRRPMFHSIAKEIEGQRVLELCCGEGELLRWSQPADYEGIDLNPVFTDHLKTTGIKAKNEDILNSAWPKTDCIVLVESLYHFLPNMRLLMDKMLEHPSRKLIISESVEHLTTSNNRVISKLAGWFCRAGGKSHPHRYTEKSLKEFFHHYGFQKMERVGCTVIGVLEKK